MSAYIVVGLTPKDQDKLQHYGASVPPTLAKYSGEILVKGPAEQLHGRSIYQTHVIIAFPNKEDASAWYHSEEYQTLIATRDAGMDSQFLLIG